MKLTDMTDEQKQAAIAKMCGWEPVEDGYGWPPGSDRSLEGSGMSPLPDYLRDLNAVAEAEKTLFATVTDGECRYRDALIAVCKERATQFMSPDVFCATAAQRCDALLLAIGAATP